MGIVLFLCSKKKNLYTKIALVIDKKAVGIQFNLLHFSLTTVIDQKHSNNSVQLGNDRLI